MIGVGILLLALIIIIGVEIGGMARDVAVVGDGTVRGFGVETIFIFIEVGVGITAPHFHAAWHDDRPHAHTLVALVGGATSVVLEMLASLLQRVAVSHLHDDGVCGVIVFISAGSIEHLLQFAGAGGVRRTVG